MTQIAERVRMHKSTVHRLLATLEKRRFVQRDAATGTYRLGIRLLQMAYLTLEGNGLHQISLPFLRHLGEQSQETVHLSVLDEPDVIFLAVVESPQRVKLAAAVGQRLPAFTTASGKAILAFMPHGAVQHILGHGMPPYTQRTLRSSEEFLESLRRVREMGFALDEQELEEGINAVAAPVLDPSDQPIASVAVAGPAYRLTRERMIEIGPLVMTAAQDIAREVEMAVHPEAV